MLVGKMTEDDMFLHKMSVGKLIVDIRLVDTMTLD